jgi:hypothetical protein
VYLLSDKQQSHANCTVMFFCVGHSMCFLKKWLNVIPQKHCQIRQNVICIYVANDQSYTSQCTDITFWITLYILNFFFISKPTSLLVSKRVYTLFMLFIFYLMILHIKLKCVNMCVCVYVRMFTYNLGMDIPICAKFGMLIPWDPEEYTGVKTPEKCPECKSQWGRFLQFRN